MNKKEFNSLLEEAFVAGYITADKDICNEGLIGDIANRVKTKFSNAVDDSKAALRALKTRNSQRHYEQFYKPLQAKRNAYQAIKNSKFVPNRIKEKRKKEYDDAVADYEESKPR